MRTKDYWRRFLECAPEIQAGDPSYRRPLDTAVLDEAHPDRSPFLARHPNRAWIAVRDGRTVGRILACVNGAHLKKYDDGEGHFGFFETIDEAAAKALVEEAAQWLRDRGCRRMLGPFNPSINHDSGLMIEGHEDPVTFGFIYGPPRYRTALEAAGLRLEKRVFSYVYDCSKPILSARAARAVARASASGDLGLRFADMRRLAAEVDLLFDIYNDGWADNWHSVPISGPEQKHILKGLRPLMRREWLAFATWKGEEIGVIVQMPDINEAAAELEGSLLPFGWARLLYRMHRPTVRNGRLMLLGIRRRFHDSYAGPLAALMLVERIREMSARHAIETCEAGWVLEDNGAMLAVLDDIRYRKRRTYGFFGKDLQDAPSA